MRFSFSTILLTLVVAVAARMSSHGKTSANKEDPSRQLYCTKRGYGCSVARPCCGPFRCINKSHVVKDIRETGVSRSLLPKPESSLY